MCSVYCVCLVFDVTQGKTDGKAGYAYSILLCVDL
jgi:hypothetical protein